MTNQPQPWAPETEEALASMLFNSARSPGVDWWAATSEYPADGAIGLERQKILIEARGILTVLNGLGVLRPAPVEHDVDCAEVVTWDWKESVDIKELAHAVRKVSGHAIYIHEVEETGGDMFAVVVADKDLSPGRVQAIFLKCWDTHEDD